MLQYKFLLNIYFCVYIGEKQEEAANLGYLILLIFIFKYVYFIDYAITVVPFSPFHSTPPCTAPPSHIPLF